MEARFTVTIGDKTTRPYKTVLGAAKAAVRTVYTRHSHIRMEIKEGGEPLFIIHADSPEEAVRVTREMLERTRR